MIGPVGTLPRVQAFAERIGGMTPLQAVAVFRFGRGIFTSKNANVVLEYSTRMLG